MKFPVETATTTPQTVRMEGYIEIKCPSGTLFVEKSSLGTQLDSINISSSHIINQIQMAVKSKGSDNFCLIREPEVQKTLIALNSSYIDTIRKQYPLALHPLLRYKQKITITTAEISINGEITIRAIGSFDRGDKYKTKLYETFHYPQDFTITSTDEKEIWSTKSKEYIDNRTKKFAEIDLITYIHKTFVTFTLIVGENSFSETWNANKN